MSCPEKISRTIKTNNYEQNNKDRCLWWQKLYEFLETITSIPFSEQLKILHESFPGCNERAFVKKLITAFENDKKIKKPPSTVDLEEFNRYYKKQKRNVGRINAYANFFKRRSDKIPIWRDAEPLTLEMMNLTQKAQAVTKAIAADFVDWLNFICDETPNTYDVNAIIEMFEIGLNNHAAKATCVRYKEMPAVPETVANFHKVPQLGKRNQLHRHLQGDIEASKKPIKKYAFSQKLPYNFQYNPPKPDIAQQFLHCSRIRTDLESMARIWQGITHLRSTRSFCEWIVEHPHIKKPRYLAEKNMFDLHSLRTRRYSVDTQTEEETFDIPEGLLESQKVKSDEFLPV